VAAPFVLRAADSSRIVGYYTLSAATIELQELPVAVARRLPRYPLLPAVLIGRLAVDRAFTGQGWGEILLVDALRRSLAQSRQIAAMAVVVDAKDAAARRFYERYGFQPLVEHQNRLFVPMKTIELLFPAS
jgi:predicted GNAT family N-acyltransferase